MRSVALIEQLESRVLFSADTLAPLSIEPSDSAQFGTTLESSTLVNSHKNNAALAGIKDYDSQRSSESSIVPDSQRLTKSNTAPVDAGSKELAAADSLPASQGEISAETNPDSLTVNWVFIDPDIEQASTLVDDIKTNGTSDSKWNIVWIDNTEDGFKRITETLDGIRNVDSIHILSHGDSNGFQLGNVKLAQSNIENYQADFEHWQQSLTTDADILIYGCDLASTENGRNLVANIAEHTQSDVAASIDTTGHQSHDANWNLEYQHGEIDTDIAVSQTAQSQWIGELPLNNAPTNLGTGIELNTDGGNDAYLSTNQGAAILGDASALTVEFLLQSTTEKEQHLFTYSTAANEAFAIILRPDWEAILTVINGTTHYFYLPEYTEITDGDIHHFAVSWDNTKGDVTIYIDGAMISQHTGLNKNETLGTDLISSITIGQQTTTPNGGHDVLKNFTGTLHDIKVWNEARTQAEITLSYQHKLDQSNLPASLIANWQMESLTGAGSDIIEDAANSFDLIVGHATGTGFLESTPFDSLHVPEKSLDGTTVGYVVPSDPDHFENIISNGNFLEGVPTNSSTTHTTGTMLGAWEVTSDDVRSHGSYLANGPDGGIALELGHTAPGQITQTIATDVGATYQMTFAMTADFDKPYTTDRSIEVAADAVTEQYTILEPNGWTTSNLLWETHTLTFTAADSLTDISFTSLNTDGTDASVVITDVQVTEVPTAIATLINGDPNMRYDAGTGKFYRYVNTPTEFFPAVANAVASELNGVKGQLLTIGSKYENDFIYNDYAIPSGVGVWIGMQQDQSNTNNEWYWMEGNEVTDKLVWLGGTSGSAQDGYYVPALTQSDASNEHWARMHTTGDQWVDTSSTSTFSYVIEWDASEVLSNFSYEFTAGGDAGGRFAIDPSSGEIIVVNGAALDYIANNSHDVEIQVTDADGNSYVKTLTIAVEDVFQLTQQVPGPLNTDEDTALVFSAANLNAITVDDGISPDDTLLRVTIENGLTGTFTLAQPNTVTIVDGSDGGATITLEGTVGEINTALNGLSYLPNQNYNGPATITVKTSVDADNLAHYEFTGNTNNSGLNPAYDGGALEGNASVTDPTDPDTLVLSTDGDGDLLPIPSLFGEPPAIGPPDITLAAKIKLDSLDLYGGEVISVGNKVILRVDGQGNLVGYAYDGSSYQKIGSEKIKLNDSAWHHVAYTLDDTNKIHTLYIDGLKVGAVSIDSSVSYPGGFNRTTIGSHAQAGNHDFEFFGSIDDARVYDRALSEAEIYGLARNNNEVTDTIVVTVNPISDAPVIDNLESTPQTYSENAPAIVLTSSLTITDIDDTNIETATVWISNGFNAGDRLNFTNQLGISGVYNAGTGELALSGSASLANYQTAIQSITFDSASEDPSEQTRTVSFTVDDGDVPSNQLSRDIEVTELNDAPTLASIESGAATYTENAAAVTITNALTVADVDDNLLESATVSISNNLSTTDALTFTDQLGISGSYNNGILTLTGSSNVANYQTALRSVGFENTSEDPSDDTRTVTFVVNDGNIDSSPVSRNITFTAVNDAPVLSAIEGTPTTYTENATAINITSSLAVDDADDSDIETAVIKITGNFTAGDTLNYTNQLGISGTYDSNNGTLTLTGTSSKANYQSAIQSISFSSTSDNPTNLTRTVSFAVNDGDIDSNSLTRDIQFTAVNDPPVLDAIESTPTSYTEDSPATTVTDTITVNDLDDNLIESAVVTISNNFAIGDLLNFTNQFGITGTYNTGTGELSLNGSSTVANYQSALRSIEFENLDQNVSELTRTITFIVNDGDADSVSVSRNIEINAVNDEPVLSAIEGSPGAYVENGSATNITSSLTVSDADDTNIESAVVAISGGFSLEDSLNYTNQLGINGTYDTNSGVLTLTGTATKTDYQTALQSISYENSSNDPSTLTRTVTFTVNDGDIDSNSITRDIQVTAVNDAPTLSAIESTPASFVEGGVATNVTALITANDPDDTDIESAVVYISNNRAAGDLLNFSNQLGITGSYTSGTGELTLTGTSSIANYQTALRSIEFENLGDDPSNLTRTVTFTINDGDTNSNAISRNIEFTAINDAPQLAFIESTPTSYTEGGPAATITNSLNVSDPDDTQIESAVVVISSNFSTNDELVFIDQLGITGVFDSAAGTLTLTGSSSVANYQTALQSIQFQNSGDDPATAVRTVTISVNDGDLDSNLVTRDIIFNAVNDAPVLAAIEGSPTSYTENATATTITSSLTANDLDDTNLESAVVAITGNPAVDDVLSFTDQLGISGTYNATNSTLTLTGTSSEANYIIAIQSIGFLNTSENPSDLTRTVTFTVNDGDTDSNSLTRDIQFNAVNDIPVLANIESSATNYVEGAAAIPVTMALTVSDVDDTNIESATVTISNNFSANDLLNFTDQLGITGVYDTVNGELTLTGTSSIANYQSALRTIEFENLNPGLSTLTRTVTFSVNDGDIDSSPLSRNITINTTNDAPSLSAIEIASTAYTENSPAISITSSLAVSDVDDIEIESAVVEITGNQTANDILNFTDQLGISGVYDSANGTLTLTGTASKANYQTALQSIGFENSSDDPSDLTRTVAFTVNDGDIDSNSVSRDIQFTAINDAPELTSIESTPISYSEGGAATAITGSITANDLDDTIIESAIVEISNNFSAGDLLNFTDQSGITGTYNSTNGTLTLNGSSTVANYQAALRTIEFESLEDNPSTLTRTATFTINDGDLNSNSVSRNIEFTAVNDAPVLASIETIPATFIEGGVATQVTSTLIVSDVDDTIIESAIVSISNNYFTDDNLIFTDQSGITGSFNSTTGELTLSGPSSVSNYQTALQSITFDNQSDDPATQTRTISFGVNDGALDSNLITRDISFDAINDAPVLSNVETIPTNYTENASPTIVTSSLTVNDVDDIDIESANVAISNNFFSGDTLTFTDQLGITGNYNSSNGLLVLTGVASEANYQTALQSIGYESANEDPSNSTRTITFTINDGDVDSNPITRDIEFTAVNDAPTLAAIESIPESYTENGSAVLITSNLTVVDLDDVNIDSATVSITTNFATNDVLNFTDQSGITGVYNAATGNLSLSGVASVSDYQNAIRSVTFENTGDSFSTATRTVSIVVNDGDIDSNVVSRNILIGVINDAPVLTSIETFSNAYTENDPGIVITNTTLIDDADDNDIESAVISISNNLDQDDELVFVSQLGITGSYDSNTGTLSLTGSSSIANYQTAIRSIIFTNNSEDPSDLTRTVSFTVNDGDIDSNTLTRDITFTAINDAPVLASLETSSANYVEGGPAASVTNDLTVADHDDIDIESATVWISSNLSAGDELIFNNQLGINGAYVPATGVLTLTGTSSEANYQSAIRTITYENTIDNPSTAARIITFTVNDGDQNSNSVSRTMTLNSVNDAPTLTTIEPAATQYSENDTPTIITNTLVVDDSDNVNIESAVVSITDNYSTGDALTFTDQLGITGIYDTTNGTLTLSGVASVANYQTALRTVGFETPGDDPSALTRTISFTVHDGDTDSNTTSRDVNVIPVNDAPVLSNIEAIPVAYTENASQSIVTSDLTATDLDDINIESATIVISSNHNAYDELRFTDQLGISGVYSSATGTLTLSGSSSISNYQTAIRSIGFENTSNDPSSLTRTVSFTVNDGDADSNQVSRDIEFTAVNDAPALASIEGSIAGYTENGSAISVTDTLIVSDVDDTNIEFATIEVSNNFDPGDLLNFTDQSGITGVYNTITGTLNLSGPSSLIDYQNALRSVSYEYSGENPSALMRTITFTVNDGDTGSNTISRNLLVNPENDAPELSNIESTPATYTENAIETVVTNSINLDDIDDTNIESATIAIAGSPDADDILRFTDQLGITGTYNSNTGILALSGTATVADYQTAIQSIGFENLGDNPAALTRTVTFVINDGNIDSNLLTRDIEFTTVNDAPVLTGIEINSAIYTEDGSATTATGSLTIADVDDSDIESATISISNNLDTDDVLTFTNQSGITGIYDSTTGTLTLTGTSTVTNYETAIRSVEFDNSNSNPSTLTRTLTFTVSDGDSNSNVVSRNLTLNVVNDAPILANIESTPTTYTENASGSIVTNNLTVADVDDINIESATAYISNNFFSGDQLVFIDQLGISGTYDSLTGMLSMSGPSSLANYQIALQSIGFANTSDNPSNLTRTVSFMVSDGDIDSNLQSRGIAVTPINDAPSLTTIEVFSTSYVEGGSATNVTSSLEISDLDDSNIESATISISSNFDFGDTLNFSNQPGITGTYDPTSGVLTLTGAASVANYETALRSISFESLNSNPSTLTRTLSFTVNDGDIDSNLLSRAITFDSINNAPELSSLEPQPATYTEGAAATIITNNLTISDIDDTNIDSATVSISNNAAMDDKLVFVDQSGISGTYDSVNGVLALTGSSSIANYQSALRSIGFENTSDNPSSLTRTITFTVNDGDLNSAQHSRDIIFTAVNDAPTGQDNVITFFEDSQYTLTPLDFGFMDTLDNHGFAGIVIDIPPGPGVLQLAGSDTNAGQFIPTTDIIAGNLVYTPTPDANGALYDNFKFHVVDTGGTASAGIDTSTAANTLAFNITSVSDEPSGLDATLITTEDTPYVFSRTDFGFTDAKDNDQFAAVTITSAPAAGLLELTGSPVQPGAVVSTADIDSGQLQYTPPEDYAGTGYGGLSFVVHDSGSNADGGENIDQSANFITFDILAINDGPELYSGTLTVDESGTTTVTDTFLSATDVDNLPDDLVFTVTDLPVNGVLEVAGVPIPPAGTFTQAQLQQGNLSYTHDGSETDSDFFNVQVSDTAGLSSSATVNISVEPPFQSALQPLTQPSLEQPITDEIETPEEVELENHTEQQSQSVFIIPTANEIAIPDAADSETIETVRNPVKPFDNTAAEHRYSTATLANHNVTQHNKVLLKYNEENQLEITRVDESLGQLEPVNTDWARNENFQRGLDRTQKELDATEESLNNRYKITSDTIMGTSIALTAGILAWLLRGGVLIAGLVASRPLWSHLDPIKFVGGKKNDDDEADDDELDNYFEN